MGIKTNPCHYCGQTADTVDHIVPKSLGGPNERANRVPSCQPCNAIKGSTMPTCRCDRCRDAVRLFGPGQARNRLDDRARLRAESRPHAKLSRVRAHSDRQSKKWLDALVSQHDPAAPVGD